MKKLTKLPEEYIVLTKNGEEVDFVGNKIGKNPPYEGFQSCWKACVISKKESDNWNIFYKIPSDCKHLPKITFEDFKRLILKESKTPIMKQEKYKIGDIIKPVDGWANGVVCKLIKDAKENDFLTDHKTSGVKQNISIKNIARLANEKEIENYKNNTIKKGEKIIGYKAPHNLFENEVKKGAIYTLSCSGYSPRHEDVRNTVAPIKFSLPAEIVEKWEAIYAPKYELPQILGYSGMDFGTEIKFGCRRFSKTKYKELYKIMKEMGILSYKIEAGEVKFEEIEQINNYLTKK